MKLLRVGPVGQEQPAVLDSVGRPRALSSVVGDIDPAFLADEGIERVRTALRADTLPELDDTLRVGPPITRVGKIVCIGLNYSDHAAETGAPRPDEPVVFMKAANTIVGPNDAVLLPPDSRKTDWEIELAVVLGRRARYLPDTDSALSCVAGYTISNDVSEREFQLERGGQWDKGKSCETFNPLGPWLVTADEVSDPQRLGTRLSVNGIQRQDSTTANMIFGVAEVVRYLSQFMVLEPGDVINTGTPAGVALGMAEQPFLRPGDVLELTVDGLGTQCQKVERAE